MDKPRVFECWIGKQRSGKTYALKRRVAQLASEKRICSVWILDTTSEYRDLAGAVFVTSWADYLERCRDSIPRVLVFGSNPVEWLKPADLISEAAAQGDVCLVVDEAYLWMPQGTSIDPAWRLAILQGRHLPDVRGQLKPLHLVMAAQYPRSMHHLAWSQANAIYVGQISGERSREWVRGEFGQEAETRVDQLGEFEWIVLRGDRPKAEGIRWAK